MNYMERRQTRASKTHEMNLAKKKNERTKKKSGDKN